MDDVEDTVFTGEIAASVVIGVVEVVGVTARVLLPFVHDLATDSNNLINRRKLVVFIIISTSLGCFMLTF